MAYTSFEEWFEDQQLGHDELTNPRAKAVYENSRGNFELIEQLDARERKWWYKVWARLRDAYRVLRYGVCRFGIIGCSCGREDDDNDDQGT